jgi:HAD superfamily hydrolase (TIGR01509 family)
VPNGTRRLAAIFDWDGVLIDSSKHHEESWERLARENGLALPADHFLKGFGMKNEAIIPDLLGWTRDPAGIRRLSLRKEELYREVIRERGIAPLPGVAEFLARLAEAGIPCAIGSSTHRLNIETSLEMIGLGGRFRALVTAEDVSRGKPDPEGYRLALALLNAEPPLPARLIHPHEALALEDSPAGLEAAAAAGLRTLGVAQTYPADRLGRADRVVANVAELSAARLSGLFDAA